MDRPSSSAKIRLLFKGKARRDIIWYADTLACLFVEYYIKHNKPVDEILKMTPTEASEPIREFLSSHLNSEIHATKKTIGPAYYAIHHEIKVVYPMYKSHRPLPVLT